MNISLKTKVSLFMTLIILFISAISTYLFTSAHRHSKVQEFDVRGTALSFALSKACEEGIIKEDLSLIKKASYIIEAPDVSRAQVFSGIWEVMDAYPPGRIKDAPGAQAIAHFKASTEPFHIDVPGGSDYYAPVIFKALEDSPPTVIGYVRLTLSPANYERKLKNILVTNIAASCAVTFIAILALNSLIGRLVVGPVMVLHESVERFKQGGPAENVRLSGDSLDEIHALAREFNRMCVTVKDNERKLVESDQRIRALFERVEHAVFRTDAEGVITEANGRFRSMFGEVTGLCDILIGDESSPNCLRRAAQEKTLHIEDRAIAKNGEECIISLSLYANVTPAGQVAGFDGYIIDVSEKKRLEERLIRSQKLEAVGTLAAGMAHDFNNILTAILGYSGIMLKMTKDDDPFHKPVSVIHDAAKRGAALGKKILSITRKEKMEAKPVNVNDIIRHSVDLLQTGIPKNIEIVTKLDESLPRTVADPSQLHQVIINLALNARDAMPDGGRLTLETSVASPANGQDNGAPRGGSGFIRLSISDTGQGMDTRTQTRIFDPFFTTKEVGKGTGLGLYIVHSIISNHGGYINLYSEPGQGTRFNVYLPVASGSARDQQPEVEDITGTETILVIDDEAHVRDLCKDMLEPLGYRVLTAENGNAGISLYREKRNEISLVVLDMIMPKSGGNEVFHNIKTINKNARVLLYSGYSHANYAGINDLLKSGAVGFVQKPFSSQDLGTAIRRALAAESD